MSALRTAVVDLTGPVSVHLAVTGHRLSLDIHSGPNPTRPRDHTPDGRVTITWDLTLPEHDGEPPWAPGSRS